MFKKKIISGCESRGDQESPYLTRYTLFETKIFQVCIHVFHRSDHYEHHDHPWDFVSIILWRGYIEETKRWPKCIHCRKYMWLNDKEYYCTCKRFTPDNKILFNKEPLRMSRKLPLMILFRKATHRHRVVLINNKPAVTLVIMGKRKRTWGFFTDAGWLTWTRYFIKNKC